MAHTVEQLMKYLDEILEHYGFETAAEAESWLKEQSENRTLEEFLDQCATPSLRLLFAWQKAENELDPEKALDLYQQAIDYAEGHLRVALEAAQNDPSTWTESKAQPYLCSLFGRAAMQEMLGQMEEAEKSYRQIFEADPLDSLGAVEKLFAIALIDGRLVDAREWLERLHDDQRVSLDYQRALLRFLESADQAEQEYQRTGDLDFASAWHDEKADVMLQRAILRNPFVPHLILHPRALEAPCPEEAEPGSPAEALQIMYATAHLWLSDLLVISWLMSHIESSDLQHHRFGLEWQEMLDLIGGQPSQEEIQEYVRRLQELDL